MGGEGRDGLMGRAPLAFVLLEAGWVVLMVVAIARFRWWHAAAGGVLMAATVVVLGLSLLVERDRVLAYLEWRNAQIRAGEKVRQDFPMVEVNPRHLWWQR